MRRTSILILTTLLLAVPASAHAVRDPSPRDSRSVTFDGTCQFELDVTYDPGLTVAEAPFTATARGPGTCSGTFTDPRGQTSQLEDAPVRYDATAEGAGSCAAGTESGPGVLRIGSHRLDFALEETRAAATTVIQLTGADGGDAVANATVSPDEDPAQIAALCLGAGVSEVGAQLSLVANGLSG